MVLISLCLFVSLGNVCARTYNVYASGDAPALTPENWGIGELLADLNLSKLEEAAGML